MSTRCAPDRAVTSPASHHGPSVAAFRRPIHGVCTVDGTNPHGVGSETPPARPGTKRTPTSRELDTALSKAIEQSRRGETRGGKVWRRPATAGRRRGSREERHERNELVGRVTTRGRRRIRRMQQSPEHAHTTARSRVAGSGGSPGREVRAATGGGKPLKTTSPRVSPARNKAGRIVAEQSVKGLRKPEGAAQPGEASPAQVAARHLERRRAPKPQGGGYASTCRSVGFCAAPMRRVRSRRVRTLNARPNGHERRRGATVRPPRRGTPRRSARSSA